MENKKNSDLLQGSVTKNLLIMSVPTMIGFSFQAVYDLIDIFWVGRISTSAVSGVTIFATLFWLVEILNEIIGTSSISLISQSYGSGDMERTNKVVEQTITFKALVAIIATVIMMIALKPLLGIFTNDPAVIKAALEFGYIRFFFLPIMFSSYTVNTALRCLGDPIKPMVLMVLTSILNLILDPVFMFKIIPWIGIPGLNLGVFGAGLATVISITIAFVIGFGALVSGKTKVKLSVRGLFQLDKKIDLKLLTIGLPSGFEVFMRNFCGIVTLKLVTLYGTAAVAAYGVGNRFINFAFMPLVGFSMGGSTIVGQCLGVDDVDRAKQTARKSAIIGIILMAAVYLFIWACPKVIAGFFPNDPSVIKIGLTSFRILTAGLMASAITMGLGCVFAGAGHNVPFLISSIISRWGIQVPSLLILVLVVKAPISLIWFSFLAADITESLVMSTAYKKGTWTKKRV